MNKLYAQPRSEYLAKQVKALSELIESAGFKILPVDIRDRVWTKYYETRDEYLECLECLECLKVEA